jgi:hypothetical protein
VANHRTELGHFRGLNNEFQLLRRLYPIGMHAPEEVGFLSRGKVFHFLSQHVKLANEKEKRRMRRSGMSGE